MKGKKFIIFDLDGTLINSVPDLKNSINYALSKFGYSELSIEEVSAIIGNGVEKMIERALKIVTTENKVDAEELKSVIMVYKKHYIENVCVDTYLYPHVLETLEDLYKANYTMAICTNKPYQYVEPILEKLSIKKYFKTWIGEDSLSTKKPNAEPLNYLMRELGFTIKETCMVGDSKNDILAAKNAGVDSIGLSYGYNYNESIEEQKPTHVISDFSTLKSLLS